MRKILGSLIFLSLVGVFLVYGRMPIIGDKTGGAAVAAASVPIGNLEQDSRTYRKDLLKKVVYHPDTVLKLRGSDVRNIFHEPELVREDRPTMVWQYRTQACVLDVYFLTSKKAPDFSPVAHYEIRAREKGVEDKEVQQDCLRNLGRSVTQPHMVDVSAFYKRTK